MILQHKINKIRIKIKRINNKKIPFKYLDVKFNLITSTNVENGEECKLEW